MIGFPFIIFKRRSTFDPIHDKPQKPEELLMFGTADLYRKSGINGYTVSALLFVAPAFWRNLNTTLNVAISLCLEGAAT